MIPNINRHKVSVCMASFNGEDYIARQIYSILDQISETDELVISDDNSTDKTLIILQQITDPRLRIVSNIGPKGPKYNFQNAIKHAKGEYIFLSDQDDIWSPNKVKTVVKYLETNDLVLTDCQVVNEYGNIIHPSFFNFRRSRPGFFYNLYKNSYIGCCMAFKRSMLSYILPIPSSVHMHDWWIGLVVEVYGKVYFCREPLIQYTRHGNNVSPTLEGGYNLGIRLKNRILLAWCLIKRIFIHR